MGEELLPLFPLQMVVFPRSALPLHIFEERYKVLVNECVQGGKEFGINLVEGENIAPVGCTVVVSSVLRRYPDGRMDIIVEGRRRYRLQRYTGEMRQYLVGFVDYFADRDETADSSLEQETVSLYNKLIDVVYKSKLPHATSARRRGGISFVLAQKAGLDLQQRQRLLESESENERLRAIRSYLADVIPKLEQFEEVERIVRSDGYV